MKQPGFQWKVRPGFFMAQKGLIHQGQDEETNTCEVLASNALFRPMHLGVSKNSGTPKSSVLIGYSLINHPFWGTTILETPTWNGAWRYSG